MLSPQSQATVLLDSFYNGWSRQSTNYGELQEQLQEFLSSSVVDLVGDQDLARIHYLLAVCLQMRGCPAVMYERLGEEYGDVNVDAEYRAILLISLMRYRRYRTSEIAAVAKENVDQSMTTVQLHLLPKYEALCRLSLAMYLYYGGGNDGACEAHCKSVRAVFTSEGNALNPLVSYALGVCDKLEKGMKHNTDWRGRIWYALRRQFRS